MNFTREPIIETVITPREGCKLVVRNSKGAAQEDYIVDAIEVVSFGHSFFFRSLERPKSFLVPVSDYEILELKETRMVLKSVSSDRSIKIGGGRETQPQKREEPEQDPALAESRPAPDRSQDRGKRDKRRRGRRGGRDRADQQMSPDRVQYSSDQRDQQTNDDYQPPEDHLPPEQRSSGERPEMGQEEVKAPSFISKLFPPPPTLINRESLSRYKTAESTQVNETGVEEKRTFEETIFEHPTSEETKADEETEQ